MKENVKIDARESFADKYDKNNDYVGKPLTESEINELKQEPEMKSQESQSAKSEYDAMWKQLDTEREHQK